MKSLNLKNINIRRVGQWLLIILIALVWIRALFDKDFFVDFEAYCPFGGLQSLATYMKSGNMVCSMGAMQLIMGGLLALSAIFVSKLFCGYVCPIGTISEGLGRLGKRLKLPSYDLGGFADMALRSLKYILLFLVFYFTIDSNDLFCKKFDPFFATVTLFGEDVSAWMATLSILILIIGAIFLRQFWCRYLCPLGAISAAFKYFYVFVVYTIIWIALDQADIKINLIFILASLSIIAYILELIGLRKNAGFQLLKIKRDSSICIDCGICDDKCPQGIKVSELDEVNHPDCNLCSECVGVCPNEQALSINGKTNFRWLPMLITVGLIMIGLIFGAKLEVPSVDLKWGNKEELNRSKTFEMSGIKNIKCYGSSMVFVDKMKKVKGITAAATYVKDHRVDVKYDSTVLNEEQVRKSVFTPKFLDISIPKDDATVYITDYSVKNFFDELDVVFIANVLKKIPGVYSFETKYGHPVQVRLYSDSLINRDSIAMLFENLDMRYVTAEQNFSSKGLYKVIDINKIDTVFSGAYLKSLSFPSFKRTFNNRNLYTNEQLANVIFPISSYPRNTQLMPYVANHLGKNNPYIVGLIAQYSSNGPIAVVFYVKDKVLEEDVIKLMMSEELKITYDNGFVEEVNNPYVFDKPNK